MKYNHTLEYHLNQTQIDEISKKKKTYYKIYFKIMNQINFVVIYTSKNCCLISILIKFFISLLNLVVSVFDRIVSIKLSISRISKL